MTSEPENDTYCCAECAGASTEELDKRLMDNIIKNGHQVNFIFPRPGDEGHQFWYSVGRSMKDRPELLITGPIQPEVGHWIINEAAKMDDTEPLQPGQEIPADTLLGGYPVRIVAVDPREAEMYDAIRCFGEDITALQIVWPDMDGRFPGEEGFLFDEHQPVFEVA